MLESCDCGQGGVKLCSSSCNAGTRDPTRVFSNILEFLNEKENENEVIMLVIKVNDETLLRLFRKIFAESPELKSFMYSHPGVGTEWPLLNDLIDSNKVSLP